MDTATIDQAYGQLQGEFQDVARSIQALAEKLQAAAQAGDTNAPEWLLDLKQVALGGFLNSGFGRAMELGAGIGLGEDIINSIF